MPSPIYHQTSSAALAAATQAPTKPLLEKQLLGVREVATYLGLSTASVWRHVKRKNLPAPIRIGGSTRWNRSDLESFLEAKTQRDAATLTGGRV